MPVLSHIIDRSGVKIPQARAFCMRPQVREEFVGSTLKENSRVAACILHIKRHDKALVSKKTPFLTAKKGRGDYSLMTFLVDRQAAMFVVISKTLGDVRQHYQVNCLKQVPSEEKIGVGKWVWIFEARPLRSEVHGLPVLEVRDCFVRIPHDMAPLLPLRSEQESETMTFFAIQRTVPELRLQSTGFDRRCVSHMCRGVYSAKHDPCLLVSHSGATKDWVLTGEIDLKDGVDAVFHSADFRDALFSKEEWAELVRNRADVEAFRNAVSGKLAAWGEDSQFTVIGWVKPPVTDEDDEVVEPGTWHVVSVLTPPVPVQPQAVHADGAVPVDVAAQADAAVPADVDEEDGGDVDNE
jgi:hypothetical protein